MSEQKHTLHQDHLHVKIHEKVLPLPQQVTLLLLFLAASLKRLIMA